MNKFTFHQSRWTIIGAREHITTTTVMEEESCGERQREQIGLLGNLSSSVSGSGSGSGLSLSHCNSFEVDQEMNSGPRGVPIIGLTLCLVILLLQILHRGEIVQFEFDSSVDATEIADPDRPPLSALVRGDEVVGDVQFLLDFAILGHGKCATTTLQTWLNSHDEVQMYDHEIRVLKSGQAAEMVRLLYDLPEGPYQRGYKCPNDIRSLTSIQLLARYWPQTKLIVGLRHPVKLFESQHNFKVRTGKFEKLTSQDQLHDLPDLVKLHINLSKLGKTNISNPDEVALLAPSNVGDGSYDMQATLPRAPNQVFLYDVSQPFDTTDNRHIQFANDLSNYLGLSRPLEPNQARTSPGLNEHYDIDICEDTFIPLRQRLLDIGRDAALWISKHFLDLPDVTVSNRKHFEDLLSTWSIDPCATSN